MLFRSRRRGSGDDTTLADFHILDISNPAVSVNEIVSKDIGIKTSKAIVGIAVKSFTPSEVLAFLVTDDSTDSFQVWNITDTSDPNNINPATSCSIYNYSEAGADFVFFNNWGFVANASNDALRIIYDSPAVCS